MSGSRQESGRRRSPQERTPSTSGPTMPNAIGTVSMGASAKRVTKSVSNLLSAASQSAGSPHTLSKSGSGSFSSGSKRRIGPVPSPLVHSNSASGGSMSRKQAADKQLAIKMRYSNKSNKSNKSARHDFDDDQLYNREEAEVEVEELASVVDQSSSDPTRHGSTHKKPRGQWTVVHDATKLASPPTSPSPSKTRMTWSSRAAMLRPGIHSSANYRLASWLGVLVIHGVCTGLHVCLAVVFAKLPQTDLRVSLPPYSPEMVNFTDYATIICVFASILAAIHGMVTIRMLRQSLSCRQLMYYAPNYFSAARSDKIVPFAVSMKALTGVTPTNPNAPNISGTSIMKSLVVKSWWVLQELLWARRDMVALNYTGTSERMYRATIVVQTIVHLIEVVGMSRLVGTCWMHHIYVMLIVINAWLPFVLTLLRNTQVILWHSHRIISLLSSTLLDAFAALVIPIALIQSYMMDYDASQKSFRFERWSCDRWFVKMLLEFQFLLTINAFGSMLRLLVGLHLLSSLNALKSLLESVTSSRPPIPSTERSVSGSPTKLSARRNKLIKIKPGTRRSLLLELLLVLAGVITLVGHLTAIQAVSSVCPLPLRPWFTNTRFCPLVELNCATEPSLSPTGRLQTALADVDAQSVRHLVIQSCPQLEVSRAIQALQQLVTFKIKHSALAAWPANAALSQQYHPAMSRLAVINVTMFQVPDGLLAADFPASLRAVHFRGTNISSLPSSLDQLWPGVETLALELSDVDQIPAVLLVMAGLRELSLTGNNISALPPELFEKTALEKLWLNGNPVATLPTDVTTSAASSLRWIALDSTNLASLPSWATANAGIQKLLGSTPYCATINQATTDLAAVGVNCSKLSEQSMAMLLP